MNNLNSNFNNNPMDANNPVHSYNNNNNNNNNNIAYNYINDPFILVEEPHWPQSNFIDQRVAQNFESTDKIIQENTTLNSNNNNHDNNNNQIMDHLNEKVVVDIYIICHPNSERLSFKRTKDVKDHLEKFETGLTNFQQIMSQSRKEDYFIRILFRSLINRSNEFGSFYHNNQIFVNSREQFKRLTSGNPSQTDSLTRKIKESFSQKDFHFQKLNSKHKSFHAVRQFLRELCNDNNANNNNNNNINNNNNENSLNDDNNNFNENFDNNLVNNEINITYNDNDEMEIDNDHPSIPSEHSPPKFQTYLKPFNNTDIPFIGENGNILCGFDNEILPIQCTYEDIVSEFYYSSLDSNLIEN